MFTTLVAIGIVVTQLAIVAFVILWVKKSSLLTKIYNQGHIIIAGLFISSAIGSMIYEYGFGYEPCLLCWYQRIFIFGIAILSLTSDSRKNKSLQKQIFAFSVLGLLIAIFHNYIDLVPSGIDVCGTGVSCLKRYVHAFGYITIPMMSFTVLLAGALLSGFMIKHSKETFISLK